MRSVLFGLVFISSLTMGQDAAMPFELERFKNYLNTEMESGLSLHELSSGELLLLFHREYKSSRSEKPVEYFPNLSEFQVELKGLIESKAPNKAVNSLIQFIEGGCTKENLENLISQPAEIKVLLPYQFMAAFALEETKKEKTYLEAMLREGMLSDVLKAWGEIALKSAAGFESIMTNGMQDLLAVRYAQLVKSMNPDIMVANKLVQKCALSDEASSFGDMWFAPTLEKNMLDPFSSRLKIIGVGFAFQVPADGDRMKTIAKAIPESSSQTPADRGLVSSYSYLQKGLEEAGNQIEAEELKKYIDKEGL